MKPNPLVKLDLGLDPAAPGKDLHNDDKLVKQILARIARGPSASDGHGFIYIYKEGGKLNGFRKIGRTERLPERRIEEWPGAVLIKSWRCRRDRHAEVLIHWLLDEVRVYRYAMPAVVTQTKDKAALPPPPLLSVWKRTKKQIQDATYTARKKAGLSVNIKDARKRHKEWFLAPEPQLLAMISRVVNAINMCWLIEPWSEQMEQMK
jgi:hypothetical protein